MISHFNYMIIVAIMFTIKLLLQGILKALSNQAVFLVTHRNPCDLLEPHTKFHEATVNVSTSLEFGQK